MHYIKIIVIFFLMFSLPLGFAQDRYKKKEETDQRFLRSTNKNDYRAFHGSDVYRKGTWKKGRYIRPINRAFLFPQQEKSLDLQPTKSIKIRSSLIVPPESEQPKKKKTETY